MKQPLLFEVPRDMTRRRNSVPRKEIVEFKRAKGIWTHNAKWDSTIDDPKWMAMLLPKDGAGNENYSDHRPYTKSDDPMEIIAGYCRVLNDTGRTEYGHTEREAIRNLCEGLKIQCDL